MMVKAEQLGMDRPDLWHHNKCLVCQSKHFSDQAKMRHFNTDAHKKRILVHDFFLNDVDAFIPSKSQSTIVQILSKLTEPLIGIECLHEFFFKDEIRRFWACSVCFCASFDFNEVRGHLSSAQHRMAFIDEYHPERKPKGRTAREISSELTQTVKMIVSEQKQLVEPELFEMGLKIEKTAEKLGLDLRKCTINSVKMIDNLFENAYSVLKGDDKLIYCKSCWEAFSIDDHCQLENAWQSHKQGENHENRLKLRQKLSLDPSLFISSPHSRLDEWLIGDECRDEWVFDTSTHRWLYSGQMVGIDDLVERTNTVLDNSDKCRVLCRLCLVTMPMEKWAVKIHVKSEQHIVHYLHKNKPSAMYAINRTKISKKRELIAKEIASLEIVTCRAKVWSGPAESLVNPEEQFHVLTDELEEDRHNKGPKITTLDDDTHAVWCDSCWKVLFIDAKSNEDVESMWKLHCKLQTHIDLNIKRKLFNFDETNFVHATSRLSVPPLGVQSPEWVIGEGLPTQTVANVGMDFLMECRRKNGEDDDVVCLLCAEILPLDDVFVYKHLRSQTHLEQFLHSSDMPMTRLLDSQNSLSSRLELMLTFLKKTPPLPGTFRVYDPNLASFLRSWDTVPLRFLQRSVMPSETLEVYDLLMDTIDRIVNDHGIWSTF